MSIFRKVIELADEFDDWKNDAVRRLVEKRRYTNKDIEELSDMVLYHHGLIEELAVMPKRIDKNIIFSHEDGKEREVILKEIRWPKNVNSLSPKGKLSFLRTGLTVIFGENGSGKSGYSRILKKCCKAKESGNVIGNVYENKSNTPAEATIIYSYAGEDKEPLRWVDGEYGGSELENILVHDSKCGRIQVNDRSEIYYLPNGGDILPALAEYLDKIAERIKDKEPMRTLPDFGISGDTKVHKFLSEITSKTTKMQVTEQLCFTDENRKILSNLKKNIHDADEDNMKNKSETLSREEKNIQEIQNFLKSNEKYFLRGEIEVSCNLVENKNELSDALKKQNVGFIADTFSPTWVAMYEAAQGFVSKIAHADHKHLTVEGKCVLCQQPLDEIAKNRMTQFSEFFEENLKKKLDDVSSQIKDRLSKLDKLATEISRYRGFLQAGFSYVSEEKRAVLTNHFEALENTRSRVIDALRNDKSTVDETLFCSSKLTLIEEIMTIIGKEKDALEKLVNPRQLINMKNKAKELEALKIASDNEEKVNTHVDYLKKYDEMLKDLNTTDISRKGTELITNFLGERFKNALSNELELLGGTDIPLRIKQSTRKAKPTFKLELEGVSIPNSYKLDSILSEGEQKIASLSGFLAEIETVEHRNGIILDDPVTSLDQKFRSRIAQRLVDEANKRQVIIFTHDLTFLFELQHLAEKEDNNVEICIQKIRKVKNSSGIVDDLAWHEKNVEKRINYLYEKANNLGASDKEEEKYNHEVGYIYSLLRETWEKLIEEILFNKVVARLRPDVQTKRLEEVTIKDEDYTIICSAMDDCSKNMAGHDTAPTLSGDKPSIDKIKKDICKIEKYKKELKNRMKEKRRKM